MNDIAPLITSVATLITSISALVAVLRATRKIEEVRHATNSLTDRLVETTRVQARAAGVAAGVKEEKDRTKDDGI